MKKRLCIVLAIGLMMLSVCGVSACRKGGGALSMQTETLFMPLGSTAVLSVTGADQTPIEGEANWSSSKTAVATVSRGVVTATAVGTTKIVAKIGGGRATCRVTVFDATGKIEAAAGDTRVNISSHQGKMQINLKKALGQHYASSDDLIAITDGQGQAVPFVAKGSSVTPIWSGDVGMQTWKFYTERRVVSVDLCHATHILGILSDFAALSDDWNEATMGNGNELFVDWKNQNATKDWYIALDGNIDGGGGKEFINYYTFGRRDAKDGGYAVFNGVFDGRGYAIKRLRTERGFITILGTTGVIKNVAFIQTRCGEVGGGGVLGWVGFGKVQDVFIQADLYYESQHQSGMYWYTDKQTPLYVQDCMVMIEMKENAGKWPSGDWNNPGFFSTNGVDNDCAETTIVNSYGISSCFTRVDGARDGDKDIVFREYEAWLTRNLHEGFGDLWEFGLETIFFGGELVFSLGK